MCWWQPRCLVFFRGVFLALVVLLMLSGGSLQAQTASQRRFIGDLYQAYFQREPSATELQEWLSWFQRGNSAEEIHASFISSEEFFNRMRRNTDRWLAEVFRIVVGRSPSGQELRYWRDRYQALRLDRRAFGLEFLKAMGNRRPGSGAIAPSNTLESLGSQVYSQARSLRSAILSEFSNDATVLRLQANSLVTAASRIRAATGQANPDLSQVRQTVLDARSAFLGVQAGLRGQYGGFESQLYLSQVKDSLQRLSREAGIEGSGGVGGPPGYYPPAGIPGWPSPDRPGNDWDSQQWRTLNRSTRALSSEVNSLYYLLQNLARQDYRYQALAADMQWYAGRVSDLSDAVNDGRGQGRLRRLLRELQQKSEEFSRRIAGQRVDVRLRQGLFQVDLHLAQIQAVVGGDGAGVPSVPPSYPAAPDYRPLLLEIDRAIAECDRLIAIYSAYVIFGRPVQVYLADLRSVRQQLQVLRAVVTSNDQAQIRRQINSTTGSISRLEQPWSQLRRSVNTSNAADMSGLSAAAARIQAFAN